MCFLKRSLNSKKACIDQKQYLCRMKELTISYTLLASWHDLPPADKQLVEQAYAIADKAYAPYSNFCVGAVVQFDDQSVLCGNNQENIAFPSGMCAERTVLFYAGANFPDKQIQKLVVVGRGELTDADSLLSPCGACRQVMVESEQRQSHPIELILVSQNNRTIRLKTTRDLLPFSFGT